MKISLSIYIFVIFFPLSKLSSKWILLLWRQVMFWQNTAAVCSRLRVIPDSRCEICPDCPPAGKRWHGIMCFCSASYCFSASTQVLSQSEQSVTLPTASLRRPPLDHLHYDVGTWNKQEESRWGEILLFSWFVLLVNPGLWHLCSWFDACLNMFVSYSKTANEATPLWFKC